MIDGIRKYVGHLLALYVSALDLNVDESRGGNDTESIVAASSVVALAVIGLGASHRFLHGPDVLVVVPAIILLILVWLAMTFIVSTRERLSLHLNLVSFWILITCLIAVIVRAVRPPPDYGATERFLTTLFLLVVLVPTHVLRCKIRLHRKLLYVVFILGGHGFGIGYLAAG